jgi:TonB family protein
MKHLLYILMLFWLMACTHTIALAQTDTVFADDYGYPCSRLQAVNYQLYSKINDDSLYQINQYDLKTDKLNAVFHKKHPDSLYFTGTYTLYDDNGNRTEDGIYGSRGYENVRNVYRNDGTLWYAESQIKGLTLTAYHPNGKVMCEERYYYGGKTKGTRYDEAGNKVKFVPFRVLPHAEYSFMGYLKKNIKYPKNSQNNDIEGRALVRFTVDAAGRATKVRVIKHVSPEVDAEAQRIITQMPPWVPGTIEDQPATMVFTQPINFVLH